MNGLGQPFHTSRLLASLASTREATLSESLSALWRSIEEWRGGSVLHDDVSLVAVEITVP